MKQFTAGENDINQRLDKFIKKLMPEAPTSFIYKNLRKKNITLNDKKASGSEMVALGDVVKLFLSDETFDKFAGSKVETIENLVKLPVKRDFDVVYEDDDIIIINKPPGLLSQKAEKNDISANEKIIAYLLGNGELTEADLLTFKPSVVNRLDRNTSGLLMAGKTLKGLQNMSAALKSRGLEKYYRCLVKGNISKTQRIKGYLLKDETKNQVTVFENEAINRKYIETEYVPVENFNGYTLIEVHLITGRSHQIRAHLSSIGHPVVGDPKYGDDKTNKIFLKLAKVDRQLLHAYRVKFSEDNEVVAELPEDFLRAINLLREAK